MTSGWPKTWSVNCIQRIFATDAQILVRFALQPAVFLRNKVVKNWKYTEWPQDDLEHLTVKKKKKVPCIHWTFAPESQILNRFAVRASIRFRGKVVENRKCTEWPQTDFEHLTDKGVPVYTEHLPTRGPNVGPFRYTISRFWDTRLSKIGNVPDYLRLSLNR